MSARNLPYGDEMTPALAMWWLAWLEADREPNKWMWQDPISLMYQSFEHPADPFYWGA